ncbi:MAG: vitamin K epoxide reductase family protein [Chloroflexota bacterium]
MMITQPETAKPDRASLWRGLAIGLAVIGLLDSLYLTWVKLANASAFCGGVGDCESVNASIYSEINGLPIAALGAGAYAVMAVLLWLEGRGGAWAAWGPLAVFGLSFGGTLYSAYLTYIEVAVLRAICPYCVLSAIVVTLICLLSVARLWQPGAQS